MNWKLKSVSILHKIEIHFLLFETQRASLLAPVEGSGVVTGLSYICQTALYEGKCKFQSSQALPKVSHSADQGPQKDSVAQKKPVLRYTRRERQKDGDITAVPHFLVPTGISQQHQEGF